jgi:hypothetical protein
LCRDKIVTQQFLERYLAGEHVAVWRELIDLGSEVQQEPLRSDAFRVCEEIVRRAWVNLRTLHGRLLDLGYEFENPSHALVAAGPGARVEIDQMERELGKFPLIARVWYQTIASVDFGQAECQRFFAFQGDLRPPAAPDIFGLGSGNVLMFQSLEACRSELRHMDAVEEEYFAQMTDAEREQHRLPQAEIEKDEPLAAARPEEFLPLGGSASNCEPKGFPLPCHGVDAIIDSDGCDTYFVDELRTAFEWGGFPFWKPLRQQPDFFLPVQYRPNFEKLLPILQEGLLEL